MNPARMADFARARKLAYGWRDRSLAWALDVTDPGAPRLDRCAVRVRAPYIRRSGSGASPRPAVDTLDYVVGSRRAAWETTMLSCARASQDPVATRLSQALQTGRVASLGLPAHAAPAELCGVRSQGRWLHEEPDLGSWWGSRLRADLGAGRDGVCLCCGRVGELARLVPAYLPTAAFDRPSAADAALFPVPKGAAARGGAGAPPVCVDCAMALGAALPALAGSREHRHRMGADHALLLWWDPSGGEPLPLGRLLEEDEPAPESWAGGEELCVLLLTCRSGGRITPARFWDLPAEQALGRVRAWQERIASDDGYLAGSRSRGLSALHCQAVGRWDEAKEAYVRPREAVVREEELWCAVLDGHRPIRHARAAERAMGDGRISAGRVALIGAARG
jgi:CRISPR-associated protein Csd1